MKSRPVQFVESVTRLYFISSKERIQIVFTLVNCKVNLIQQRTFRISKKNEACLLYGHEREETLRFSIAAVTAALHVGGKKCVQHIQGKKREKMTMKCRNNWIQKKYRNLCFIIFNGKLNYKRLTKENSVTVFHAKLLIRKNGNFSCLVKFDFDH